MVIFTFSKSRSIIYGWKYSIIGFLTHLLILTTDATASGTIWYSVSCLSRAQESNHRSSEQDHLATAPPLSETSSQSSFYSLKQESPT